MIWSPDIDNIPDDYSTVLRLSQSTGFQSWRAFLATGLYACKGSSDGSTAGMDDVDRLSNGGVFNAALWGRAAPASPHAWGVVYSALFGLWICMDVSGGADNYAITWVFSRTPFTGGSTSARPSAGNDNEWSYVAASGFAMNDNTASLFRLHMVYSERGDFWMWNSKTGSNTDYWALGALKLVPPAGYPATDANDIVTYCNSSGTAATAAHGYGALFNGGTGGQWRGRTGGGTLCAGTDPYLAAYASGFVGNTNAAAMVAMPATGGQWSHAYVAMPIDIYVYSTTWGDLKGSLPDITAAPWGLPRGYPNSNPCTRRAFGALWLPGMDAVAPTY